MASERKEGGLTGGVRPGEVFRVRVSRTGLPGEALIERTDCIFESGAVKRTETTHIGRAGRSNGRTDRY